MWSILHLSPLLCVSLLNILLRVLNFCVYRASNGNRLSVDSCPVEVIAEKPRCVRQVHPVCEEKAHVIAYDKRASLDSNPPAYPLAPNICVEAGRIEFIKMPPDGNETETIPTPPLTPKLGAKVTVTRAQQTSDDEKFDVAKVGGSTICSRSPKWNTTKHVI